MVPQSYCRAHLVNYSFHQTHCTADQFINCATFDELHNIWSFVQHNCSRVGIRVMSEVWVRVKTRVWVRIMISFRLGLVLELGLD